MGSRFVVRLVIAAVVAAVLTFPLQPLALVPPQPAVAANGCGSEGSLLKFPDGDFWILALASYSFLQSCNDHDDCYGRPGSDRADCDRRFLNDMLSECSSISWLLPLRRLRCTAQAYVYYKGVAWFGEGAFLSGQLKSAVFAGTYDVSRTVIHATGGWAQLRGDRQRRTYTVTPGCSIGGCDLAIESVGGPRPFRFVAQFAGGTDYDFTGPGVFCDDRPVRGGSETVHIRPTKFKLLDSRLYVTAFRIKTTFVMPPGVACEQGVQWAEGVGVLSR